MVQKSTPTAAIQTGENDISVTPWYERISIKRHAQQRWASDKMNYGILIHSVLGKIKTAADIKHVLQNFVTSGVIPSDEMAAIKTLLEKIVHHPELQIFFNPENEIFNETSILLPQQSEIRPDRIAISEKQAYLLDYKTGEHREEHNAQLQKYATELEKMGYEIMTAKLVYLKDGDDVVISKVN